MTYHETYYQLLGLREDATAEEIKATFKSLAKKFHPDVNHEADAADKFKEVQSAYEVLGDEKKKRLYDRELKEYRELQEAVEKAGGGAMSEATGNGLARFRDLPTKTKVAVGARYAGYYFLRGLFVIFVILVAPLAFILWIWNTVKSFVFVLISWLALKFGILILLTVLAVGFHALFKVNTFDGLGNWMAGFLIGFNQRTGTLHFMVTWEWVAVTIIACIMGFMLTKDTFSDRV